MDAYWNRSVRVFAFDFQFPFPLPFENSSAAICFLIAWRLPSSSLCNYCLPRRRCLDLFTNGLSKSAMSSADHLPAAAKPTTYHISTYHTPGSWWFRLAALTSPRPIGNLLHVPMNQVASPRTRKHFREPSIRPG